MSIERMGAPLTAVEEEGPAMSYLKIVMRGGANDRPKPLPHKRRHLAALLLLRPTRAFRRLDASNSFMHCTAAAADTLLCNRIGTTPHPHPGSGLAASLLLVGVWRPRPVKFVQTKKLTPQVYSYKY